MRTLKSIAISGILASSAAVAPAVSEEFKPLTVKPMEAFTVEVGAKRVIGYYLDKSNNCQLTVLLSDMSYVDDGILPTASRLGVKVAAGNSAKIDTIDGRTMAFSCAADAKTMGVQVYQRLAYSPIVTR